MKEDFSSILRARYRYYAGVKVVSLPGKCVLVSWLLFSALFLRNRIAGCESWRLPEVFFPHISLIRPQLLDPLRIVVQIFWLFFMRTPPQKSRTRVFPRRLRYVVGGAKGRLQGLANLAWLQPSFWQTRDADVARRHRQPLTIALAAVLAVLCITVPLDPLAQFVFATALFEIGRAHV